MNHDEHSKSDSQMQPDSYQQAWRAQSSQTRVTIDADLLLKEVQRSHGQFRAMIFWRDFREVGVAVVMVPVWIAMGIVLSLSWAWYLGVPAFIWVAAYLVVDRIRHKQKPIEPGEPLVKSATESLKQVEHQIWLLRNVFWWYILPLFIAELAFFADVAWSFGNEGWLPALIFFVVQVVFVSAINYFVYRVNQNAVRKSLEPRRQELLKLIASLTDENASEVSGEYPILMNAETCKFSRRRLLVAGVLFVVFLSIGVAGIVIGYRLDHPEKSPFAAVRWQESQPEVKVGDEWFKLVSLDGVPASEIVAFSRRTYGNLWGKRFEEDLIALLTAMGHEPKDTVRLVVTPVGSQETRTLEDVPMTRANRKRFWDAAQERERGEREQPTRGSPHVDNAESPITKLVVRLRKEKDLVGLAAMVMVDGKVVSS